MTSSAPQLSLSQKEVAQHNTTRDIWVIIDQDVYDLTSFMDEHPGGSKSVYFTFLLKTYVLTPSVLLSVAGKDGTKSFRKYHRDSILHRYKERLQVGVLRPLSGAESRSRGLFAWLKRN